MYVSGSQVAAFEEAGVVAWPTLAPPEAAAANMLTRASGTSFAKQQHATHLVYFTSYPRRSFICVRFGAWLVTRCLRQGGAGHPSR